MQDLLKPEIGLIFWTLINFAVLVFLLSKIAWKPILKAIRQREENIRRNVQTAETAKNEAVRAQTDIERKLSELAKSENEILQKAKKAASEEKDKILAETKLKSDYIMDKAKKDLLMEKDKLSALLKKEVADISILAAQKIISKELDKKTNERLVNKLLGSLQAERNGKD